MDLDRRREIIQQGREMRELLKNTAFQGLMDKVLFDLYCQFQALDDPTHEDLLRAWSKHQALKQIMDTAEAVADSGRVEEENKKHDEDL